MFASHSWPRWGNERIQEVMKGQRDMYAHMNNQVLHLANQGVTINEIHNEYEVPKSLQQQWIARGYHGSFEHNTRGVVNKYLGYWDANPTNLIPLSPADSLNKLVTSKRVLVCETVSLLQLSSLEMVFLREIPLILCRQML